MLFRSLKQSRSLDIFPTPIEKIIQYAELSVDETINLSTINNGLLSQLSEGLSSAFDKIRGILDRESKTIYLDLNQNANRKSFVKLHEVGHDVLPWQKNVLKYLDDDNTLDEFTQEEFEGEANYFASTTLFQNERFIKELKNLPLSIESSIHLAKLFGSSIHASLRRYVERNHKRCSLLVLENFNQNEFQPKCNVRNYFQSESFTTEFGILSWDKELGFTLSFVTDHYKQRRLHKDGIISLQTKNGEVLFDYHFFNNGWNTFVLFIPKGETNRIRKKVVFGIK